MSFIRFERDRRASRRSSGELLLVVGLLERLAEVELPPGGSCRRWRASRRARPRAVGGLFLAVGQAPLEGLEHGLRDRELPVPRVRASTTIHGASPVLVWRSTRSLTLL